MGRPLQERAIRSRPRRVVVNILRASVLLCLAPPLLGSQTRQSIPAWIQRSDAYSAQVVEVGQQARPESASANASLDEDITDVSVAARQRAKHAFERSLQQVKAQQEREKEPNVREDLEILSDYLENRIRAIELEDEFELPYLDPATTVFAGVSPLLTNQMPAARRLKALIRLRKYAGLQPGTSPLTTLTEQRLRQALKKRGLSAPPRSQVENDLAQANGVLDDIGALFQKYDIAGFEPVVSELKQQIARYDKFIRQELLPNCPVDRRLPPELYQFRMRQFGVDVSPSELAQAARIAFRETQSEMEALSKQIISNSNLAPGDYRSLIRALKKDQLQGDAIVDEYAARLRDIEQIIEREKLVTLPPGKPRIRVATAAESVYYGAPVTICPPSRRRPEDEQQCETVLPLALTAGATPQAAAVDDYTYAASSWTLAAHEIRPGHELQYDAMIASGVSVARASLGVKLANPEGWAVYSEYLMRPFMPAAARLISLQFLLLREARAFLDPELQAGTITTGDAYNLLKNDVVLSDAMTNAEVRRLNSNPGSGPSYLFGYTELRRLREDVERALGARFDQQRFHDFVLAQGKIRISIIRKAVFDRFVKSPAQAVQ